MRIYLVRHGQSEANVDKRILRTRPDHAIGLSAAGVEQAKECAEFLTRNVNSEWVRLRKHRIWHSPYLRAIQTAEAIEKEMRISVISVDRREHILIGEQQFGLFDGLFDGKDYTDNEIAAKYPDEWEHYQRHANFEGVFWARTPLGESRFDVAQRVHQAFGTFQRDADRHDIKDLIIVAHGVVIRAFVMMWCHKSVAWFENEPNPKNCSVRLIDTDGEDRGYIYPGFDKLKR